MIFVTGANGFLGRHVVHRLAAAGPVRALVRAPASFRESFPGAEVAAGDLLADGVLEPALAGVETVVHLASKNVDHDGTGFERINVEGTRRLCRSAVASGVRRLIYVSSVGVYGHGAHAGADETTPLRPDTPFSRSKAAAEEIVLSHRRAGDLDAVVLRHRFVYGEGDRSVMPRLVKAARRYPFWISGGRAKMSLVWAPDFARVVQRMCAGSSPRSIYHVTDGRPISYREVVTELCRRFGYRPPRLSVPFRLLYLPVRLRERLLGIDPETASGSVTSIRLQLVAQHNYFSGERLRTRMPDLRFATFAEGLERSLSYYSQFERAGLRAGGPTGSQDGEPVP